MTEYEDPDFRASKYPPNPAEVTYWIDITEDPSGNLIKTYDYTLKKWLYLSWHPLDVETRRAKAKEHALDLITGKRWKKECEIVNKLGFIWEGDYSDYKLILLPKVDSNTYFKTGDTLMEIIKGGDAAIKKAIDDETARAKNAEEQELVARAAIDTQHDKKLKELEANYKSLKQSYDSLNQSYLALQKDVADLKGRIPAAEAQASDKLFDDLGLG